jgi:hypothetical protein
MKIYSHSIAMFGGCWVIGTGFGTYGSTITVVWNQYVAMEREILGLNQWRDCAAILRFFLEFSGTSSKLSVAGEKSLLVNFPEPCSTVYKLYPVVAKEHFEGKEVTGNLNYC